MGKITNIYAGGVRVRRVQSGVRMEKRVVQVLKGLAEYLELTLGDLLEGIVLHAFEGKVPFTEETRKKIEDLMRVYDLEIDAGAPHKMTQAEEAKENAAKENEANEKGEGKQKEDEGDEK